MESFAMGGMHTFPLWDGHDLNMSHTQPVPCCFMKTVIPFFLNRGRFLSDCMGLYCAPCYMLRDIPEWFMVYKRILVPWSVIAAFSPACIWRGPAAASWGCHSLSLCLQILVIHQSSVNPSPSPGTLVSLLTYGISICPKDSYLLSEQANPKLRVTKTKSTSVSSSSLSMQVSVYGTCSFQCSSFANTGEVTASRHQHPGPGWVCKCACDLGSLPLCCLVSSSASWGGWPEQVLHAETAKPVSWEQNPGWWIPFSGWLDSTPRSRA